MLIKRITPLIALLFFRHFCFCQTTPIIQFRPTVKTENSISPHTFNLLKTYTTNQSFTRISDSTVTKDSIISTMKVHGFQNFSHLPYKEILDSAKILLDNYIPNDQDERDKLLIKLEVDSLAKTRNDDLIGLNRINTKITNIQIYNTNEFLSQLKKPIKPFTIHRLRYFDVDTLNKYWYNQKKISSLQSVGVNNFTNSNTTISAEFVSALFGPIRVGISGSFTTQQDSNKNNAIKGSLQKILNNGGALNANILIPLIYCRDRKDQVHFGIYAQSIWGINPGINDSTGNTDFSDHVLLSNESGFLFHIDLGSNDFKTRFSFDIPYYYVWGSKETYSQLGVQDYSLIKLQFGLIVGDLINLNVSGPLLSTSKTIQKIPFSFSIQFSPSQVIKATSGD